VDRHYADERFGEAGAEGIAASDRAPSPRQAQRALQMLSAFRRACQYEWLFWTGRTSFRLAADPVRFLIVAGTGRFLDVSAKLVRIAESTRLAKSASRGS